jgi:hypothetical protein
MEKAKRLKPGPKANAKLRHKKAALYFTSISCDEGIWTCEEISRLCEALYGVKVSPDEIVAWEKAHRKAAEKIKETEFRTTNDLMV